MASPLGSNRSTARLPMAVAVVTIIVVALSGCGQTGERFSPTETERALASLDAIEAGVREGDCTAAKSRVDGLVAQTHRVNSDRPGLGAAFAESVQRLQELVDADCRQLDEPPTEAVTDPTGEVTEPTGGAQPNGDQPSHGPEPTGGGRQPVEPVVPGAPGEDQSGGVAPG
ncbi:MAG: hypothetical protein WAP37_01550 [Solirubrobacterales bacterium]